MNNLKNIIAFEYGLVIKNKAFIITTLIFAILGVVSLFIPDIINFFSGGDDNLYGNESVGEPVQIAVIDDTNIFTDALLSEEMNANFSRNFSNIEDIVYAVEGQNYSLGIYFISPLDYVLVFENSIVGPMYADVIERMVRETYVINTYGSAALEILNTAVNTTFIPVGGAGFVVGQIVSLVIFLMIIYGASSISMSIVNEKTSKIVEVLFTSATPAAIIIGKVISGILIIFTRVTVIIAPFVIGMILTGSDLLHFLSPQVLGMLLDPVLWIYTVIIFFIAFISYGFLYAGLSAMANDASEASSVQTLPSLLLVGSYYFSILMAANPPWLSELILNIATFFPFISPIVLITRMTSLTMDTYMILLAIAANIVYAVLGIFISIKLYERYISSKGENPLKKFFGSISGSKKKKKVEPAS